MMIGWYADRPWRSLKPTTSMFHVDGRSFGPGAGSAEGGGDPPPVNATGGIAGPFGTNCCVCASGVAISSAAPRHDASSGRLRFRMRMSSPSEPEYHVELRRPRRLLVVLDHVEVRVV